MPERECHHHHHLRCTYVWGFFFTSSFFLIIMLLLPTDDYHQPLSISGLKLFFAILLTCLTISNKAGFKLFTNHHGRAHRLAGLFHLLWLLIGAFVIVNNSSNNYPQWRIKCLAYDTILGISGVITTLTAASSFPHKYIINRQGESGTLSRNSMVSQNEMIEHSFYQGMNFVQALYLHLITWGVAADSGGHGDDTSTTIFAKRCLMLFLVTLPWAIRKRFPVNSFSANWKNVAMDRNNRHENMNNGDGSRIRVGTEKGKSLWLINGMYRFKKWQYVFYKHVILHGLNISVATAAAAAEMGSRSSSIIPLPLTSQWRIFWLLLNTSYVMEFFLQSLVKRQVLTQRFMMVLNALLMTSASIASMESNDVLGQVKIEAAVISLFLNFYNRGHDILNTMVTFTIVYFGNNFIRRI